MTEDLRVETRRRKVVRICEEATGCYILLVGEGGGLGRGGGVRNEGKKKKNESGREWRGFQGRERVIKGFNDAEA